MGHLHELISHHNHHPGNSGPALWTDIAIPLVAIVVYLLYRKAQAVEQAVASQAERNTTLSRSEADARGTI